MRPTPGHPEKMPKACTPGSSQLAMREGRSWISSEPDYYVKRRSRNDQVDSGLTVIPHIVIDVVKQLLPCGPAIVCDRHFLRFSGTFFPLRWPCLPSMCKAYPIHLRQPVPDRYSK